MPVCTKWSSIKNQKDSSRKPLGLVNSFSKVAEYKINTQNPLASPRQ